MISYTQKALLYFYSVTFSHALLIKQLLMNVFYILYTIFLLLQWSYAFLQPVVELFHFYPD